MSDPTPHARRSPMEHERDATPAGNLVERAADLFLDAILCDPDCHATYPAIHDAARAVVALALVEAASRIDVMPRRVEKLGGQSTSYVQLGGVLEALRAMTPEAKP